MCKLNVLFCKGPSKQIVLLLLCAACVVITMFKYNSDAFSYHQNNLQGELLFKESYLLKCFHLSDCCAEIELRKLIQRRCTILITVEPMLYNRRVLQPLVIYGQKLWWQ